MEVQVSKKELLSLIGKTQNIVDKRNTMPILVNVLLEADEKGTLTVFATDLEVSLVDSINAKIIKPGKIVIQAKNLFEIIRELDDDQVQLKKTENNWVEIRQNKYFSKIVGVSPEEYPIFPSYSGQNFLKVDGQLLREMIDKTIYSISSDESRYHLNGVYFEKTNNDNYTMVATDGHRLSLVNRKIPSDKSISLPSGVIIPRKGLTEIKKMLEAYDGDFDLSIDGSQVVLKKENTTLMIRLIEGKYPNYSQFIPQNLRQKIRLNREEFLNSLKRVSLLANQKSKAITLSLSNGKMEIASNNPELGTAKEEIEVDYKGSELKIGFNAKYIQDVLTAIDNTEVDFELNDQLSPSLMRPHDDKSYTCVVMPMRI